MRGTNIFRQISTSIFEANAGRIHWRSNMWALVGSHWDKNRIIIPQTGDSHTLDGGRKVLVKRRCVLCPWVDKPEDFADCSRTGPPAVWVPATECRKCEYHRPARRGGAFRFARCVYGRSAKASDAAVNTLVQVTDMINTARKQAGDVLK